MTLAEVIAKMPATWPPGAKDFRAAGALVAAAGFGAEVVGDLPVLINCGALALAMGSRPTKYELKSDIITLIEKTDLRSVPASSPTLLHAAAIIDAKGAALFGATTDMGIYPTPDGRIGIIGLGRDADGAAYFTLWRPHWSTSDLDDPDVSAPGLVDDVEGYAEWSREAIRFLLIFSILLEASRTPVVIEDGNKKKKKSVRVRDQSLGRDGWTTRYISIARKQVYRQDKDTDTPSTNVQDLTDRIPEDRLVSGHLKRQAFGKGHTERRWIYVEAYEARRWLSPGPRKYVVDV